MTRYVYSVALPSSEDGLGHTKAARLVLLECPAGATLKQNLLLLPGINYHNDLLIPQLIYYRLPVL